MSQSRIIKNRDDLATSDLRSKALDIIEAGIRRVLPDVIIQTGVKFQRSSRELSISDDIFHLQGRIFVIGGGKASGLMAQALEKTIGADIIQSGLVIEKAEPRQFETRKIKIRRAGHPIPDRRGLDSVKEMLFLKRKHAIDEKDLVLCLISGGGSALMPYPAEGISLADKQEITRLLLSSGADIYEINAVRKHISGIKGGRLAQYFSPARVISLILSDVIGNDLSIIASGPTYPDSSTFSDAYAVLEKYSLLERAPPNIKSILELGCRGKIAETPKSLNNASNYIIGDNSMALEAMAEKARLLGFTPLIISSRQTGDTVAVARQRAAEIWSGVYTKYDALIIGGETTPSLPDKPGRGGRNQHYAACTLEQMRNFPRDWLLASVGTDGSDFIPDAAGAIVDRGCTKYIDSNVINFKALLNSYDSNTILARVCNSLIITGDTHTNVGDVMLYLFENHKADN